MAYSYVNYTGNGSLKNYSVPFPYLYKTHVKVYVQGILQTEGTDYTYPTSSTIQFTTAPLANEIITIKRESEVDNRLVDFQTGTILKEADLDLNSTQLFYLLQEAYDLVSIASDPDSYIFTTPEAILDALQGKITGSQLAEDLATPIGQLKSDITQGTIFEYDADGIDIYEYGCYSEGLARLEADEGIIQGLVTDVEGNMAQLALMADEFFVKLDGHGNVAGFGLYNGSTSQFIVNADQFGVMKADGTGNPIVPFVVDTSTSTIAIDGNLIVSGSILAEAIKTGEIQLTHLSSSAQAVLITAGKISGVAGADSAGLYLGSDKCGYYTGSAWKTYMDNSGNFYLGGSGGALEYIASTGALALAGSLTVSSSDGIIVEAGGDVTLTGDLYNPAKLIFDGTTADAEMYIDSNNLLLFPLVDDAVNLSIGSTSKRFNAISLTAEAGVDLHSRYDQNNLAAIDVFGGGGTTNTKHVELYCIRQGSYAAIELKHAGTGQGSREFSPTADGVIDLGDALYAYDRVYAYEYPTVADFYWMDDFDDMAELLKIKPLGKRDSNGLMLIDDDTLPDFLVHKNADGSIARNPDNKPYINLKVSVSHIWGCLRQLNDKIENLIGDN